jgi:hypothetical protein
MGEREGVSWHEGPRSQQADRLREGRVRERRQYAAAPDRPSLGRSPEQTDYFSIMWIITSVSDPHPNPPSILILFFAGSYIRIRILIRILDPFSAESGPNLNKSNADPKHWH